MACLGSLPISGEPSPAPVLHTTLVPSDTPTPIPTAAPIATAAAGNFSLPQNGAVLPRGRATINNAWTGYDSSGFRFDNASIVSWASRQADILASSRNQSGSTIWFFIPNDSPPYQSQYDKGAKSGIIEMPQKALDPGIECPPDGYQFHWVEARVGAVYCVRTRDGQHFALIQVALNEENLVFDWVYLSAESPVAPVDVSPLPPQAVNYTSMNQEKLILYPITGRNIVLLVPSQELDKFVLEQMVDTFDRAYDFYRDATGRTPRLQMQYQGLSTIAVVPSTCGVSCGYLGMTGIELRYDQFDKLYRGVFESDQYDPSIFYEMGHNFWFYENKIEYIGTDHTGAIADGYAIYMLFLAMEAAGVKPAPYNDIDFSQYKAEVEGLLPIYLLDTSLNWDNTLRIGDAPPNSLGLGGSALFASFLLDLHSRIGDDFDQWLWKEVDLRPDAVTTQDAIDNFVLATCTAAEKNLTRVFVERYRWYVSSETLKEARTRFGDALRP